MASKMSFPTDDEICKLMGKADIYFAGLEDQIEFFIWELATPTNQQIGQSMTAEMSFFSVLNTIMAVYRTKFGTNQTNLIKMESLISRASEINNERNNYTHSTYAASAPGRLARIRTTAKNMKGKKIDFTEITKEMLEQHIEKISYLAAELQEFLFSHLQIPTVESANNLVLPAK